MKKYLIPITSSPKNRIDYGILHHNFSIDNYRIGLHGLKKAKESTVLVLGCIRNIDKDTLIFNLDKLGGVLNHFKDHHIFLYENDSNMECKAFLRTLKQEKLTIQSEFLRLPNLGGGRDYNRVYCMSMCRNKYVSYFNKHPDYDYILIFDFDLYDFRPDGIFHSLGLDGWDMVGSNGLQNVDNNLIYYDTFALIESNYKAYADGEGRNTFGINNNPHKVFSCFGGIGIFTNDAFRAGQKYYVPKINNIVYSEHCSFAINMHKNYRDNIFINPCMVCIR